MKNPVLKEKLHMKRKHCRELVFTLTLKNKKVSCNKNFETNLNVIKNIWKGIKSESSL